MGLDLRFPDYFSGLFSLRKNYGKTKKKLRKTSLKSSLDELSGVGAKRKKHLLRYFGSMEQIKRASIDDLCEVSGIGKNTAESIFKEIHT